MKKKLILLGFAITFLFVGGILGFVLTQRITHVKADDAVIPTTAPQQPQAPTPPQNMPSPITAIDNGVVQQPKAPTEPPDQPSTSGTSTATQRSNPGNVQANNTQPTGIPPCH